ncbi:MAG TPA: hypothetical protein PLS88_04795 [Rectinema sp.]|jgi:hypothetical protein|nr:hypothetical protein [Spirochaetaceae bacterium]HOD57974.1 hypothetical protein [Rectinema sp.]HOE75016.1 hypothetical protein [Rectinema sp.]HOR47853.1 hypothetical protein [Rectinema sp.]HOU06695.1 hypothetical protein [Rectinema sp.]
MKKKVFLSVLAALLISVPVFAATQVETTIQATIGADLSITTNIPGTKAIDITASSTTLGSVTISSNLTNWKIVIHSAKGGKMVRVGGSDVYPYLLNFGSTTGIDLASDYEIVKTAPQSPTSTTVVVTYTKASELNPALPAGTYEDTLTISLVAL